jgi:hypothetical protein
MTVICASFHRGNRTGMAASGPEAAGRTVGCDVCSTRLLAQKQTDSHLPTRGIRSNSIVARPPLIEPMSNKAPPIAYNANGAPRKHRQLIPAFDV